MPLTEQFLHNLKRFRLVTFDVTDTLIQLKDPMLQYAHTAADYGVPNVDGQQLKLCFRQQFKIMSQEHPNYGKTTADMSWQTWWLKLVTETFRCVDASIPQTKLDKISQELLVIYRTSACWTHIECAVELVERVRQAGKIVGVISNFDPSLSQVLSAMGLLKKFDFILTSYEAGVMKPDKGIFQIPLDRLHITAGEALHIGNKLDLDYMGARNSGWSGLLIQNCKDLTDKNVCKHAYSSLAEMCKALETKEIVW